MNDNGEIETRQKRRQKRLEKKKERMPKHGKNLMKIYRDAILKRFRGNKDNKS